MLWSTRTPETESPFNVKIKFIMPSWDDEEKGSRVIARIKHTDENPDVELKLWNPGSRGYKAELVIAPKTQAQAYALTQVDSHEATGHDNGKMVFTALDKSELTNLFIDLDSRRILQPNITNSLQHIVDEATAVDEKVCDGKGGIFSPFDRQKVEDHVRGMLSMQQSAQFR